MLVAEPDNRVVLVDTVRLAQSAAVVYEVELTRGELLNLLVDAGADPSGEAAELSLEELAGRVVAIANSNSDACGVVYDALTEAAGDSTTTDVNDWQIDGTAQRFR